MSKVRSIGTAAGSVAGGASGGAGGDGGDGDDGGSEADRDTDPNIPMQAMPDKDELESRRDTTPMPHSYETSAAGLPTGEAKVTSAQQAAALRAQLDEAQGAFAFMGTGHPQYESMRSRIEQLEAMLSALDG